MLSLVNGIPTAVIDDRLVLVHVHLHIIRGDSRSLARSPCKSPKFAWSSTGLAPSVVADARGGRPSLARRFETRKRLREISLARFYSEGIKNPFAIGTCVRSHFASHCAGNVRSDCSLPQW